MIRLTPATRNFIIHWGQMGARWGINRTVAQIYALLYISPSPLNAEEISETLSVARSTISTGLRELQSWGVVKVVQVLGDRRDHFEAMGDVWEMFRAVVDERKRRELDPTLEMLRQTVSELQDGGDDEGGSYARERLLEMLDFFETVMSFYEQVQQLSTDTLMKIAKTGDVVRKLLGLSSGS
jgi:DNA-binding transcriptional regulator GbsR (MarR family)